MANDPPTREEQVSKLNELIKDVRIAMLTTVEPDGGLRSRPMATQDVEFDGRQLWFFTWADSPKVDEVERDRHVNVAYAGKDQNVWVSVTGSGRVVRDRAKMEELWKPFLKAWFPDGLDDPNLALLRVDVTDAEYWDTSSGPVVHALGLAKALVTRQSYQPGENEKVHLADG